MPVCLTWPWRRSQLVKMRQTPRVALLFSLNWWRKVLLPVYHLIRILLFPMRHRPSTAVFLDPSLRTAISLEFKALPDRSQFVHRAVTCLHSLLLAVPTRCPYSRFLDKRLQGRRLHHSELKCIRCKKGRAVDRWLHNPLLVTVELRHRRLQVKDHQTLLCNQLDPTISRRKARA